MLYLLIVNYYSTDLILALLQSIPEADRANLKIIIVNNSPGDRTLQPHSATHPNLTLLTAPENLGFGGGCNLGLTWIYERDPHSLVWLINPDTTLADAAIDYIQTCFQEHPHLAILGTQIQDTQGNPWFTQGKFNPWLGSLPHQHPISPSENPTAKIIPSRWVSGCSLILNLAQFPSCPQFDRHYFLYYEDNDLCERYFQQGYSIAVTEAILVTHQVSATSQNNLKAKLHHATFSKLYFLQQHGTPLALLLNLGYLSLKAIADWIKQNPDGYQGRWQGLQQFLQAKSCHQS
ncbi:glycosyltransferase [Roseofilum sp. BLCC_M91]|uniref:Glycosyltransferase n=1 Tax=Roseofilum halophilum BLCC-M91 TaxID=3022259 RepID=A0ABT7BRA0_9CYAN|nr:glycosyltransferase [Roseofilum halophilum]MDJ1181011.1 glycosyltransferase [Roseofilum halophilum BLCC-M91]